METKEKIDTKEVVLSLINALNNEDFTLARSFVNDGMTFVGVLGSRDGANAYFKDMELMKLKYELQKVFVEGNDVCLIYTLKMSGVNVTCCGLYEVQDGKVVSLKVIFDPRQVIESTSRNNKNQN